MGKNSVLVLLGILILLSYISTGYLFLYPAVPQKVLKIAIVETNQNGIINSIDVSEQNKPRIELFSKKNPTGNFNLNVKLSKENGEVLLDKDLSNIGLGESSFKLEGDFKGKFEAEVNLRLGEKQLDSKKIDFEG